MKILNFKNTLKNLTDFIPKRDIEKLVFKALVGVWIFVVISILLLRLILDTNGDIERRITKTIGGVQSPITAENKIEKYKSSLSLVKYPEGIDKYMRMVKRDPFSKYKERIGAPKIALEHNFVLKSINKIQLPLVYKGYIELSDTIIGQVNWRNSTRFVQVGSILDSYKILSISKEKIEAVDGKGQNVIFRLNELVHSDELQAVLYDRVTDKTFDAVTASEIDSYKVIDITPDHVILMSGSEKIKLEISGTN